MTDRIILDKVLSDERTAAYATTIDDINRRWLNCKDCDWYKSKQTIMSEAKLQISQCFFLTLNKNRILSLAG